MIREREREREIEERRGEARREERREKRRESENNLMLCYPYKPLDDPPPRLIWLSIPRGEWLVCAPIIGAGWLTWLHNSLGGGEKKEISMEISCL